MGLMHGLLHSFVCSVAILTLSFFVLLASKKIDSQWIKTFGYVIVALLWVSAALVFENGLRSRPRPMMDIGMRVMPPMGNKMHRGNNPSFQGMRGGIDNKMEKMIPPEPPEGRNDK
jgi:hypothetical protein